MNDEQWAEFWEELYPETRDFAIGKGLPRDRAEVFASDLCLEGASKETPERWTRTTYKVRVYTDLRKWRKEVDELGWASSEGYDEENVPAVDPRSEGNFKQVEDQIYIESVFASDSDEAAENLAFLGEHQDRSGQESADILKISPEAFRARKSRACKALRQVSRQAESRE